MTVRIKGILFDLGETLLNFGKIDINSVFEHGARLSYDYLSQLEMPLPPFKKYHRRQLWAIRWNYFKSRLTGREFNSLDLIGRMGARMGHKLTPKQTLQLAWLWYQPLGDYATAEEGTREMLDRFSRAGLKLALVSNTFVPGEILDRHLQKEGLLELLPVRVYSCDVGYRKPNQKIFRIALQQAGLAASDTLFVGDSLEADVRGANRAGMISVLKDPKGQHPFPASEPRHRISRLAELEDIVSQYSGAYGSGASSQSPGQP
ncbi:MAG: HAD family hydrolase [Phycisphaerae bacterium]|nr:HAD family hydrolase [Phycisphaerae bacterium]